MAGKSLGTGICTGKSIGTCTGKFIGTCTGKSLNHDASLTVITHYLLPPGFGILSYPSLFTGLVILVNLLPCLS